MTPEQIEIIASHARWLKDSSTGQRANLRDADLRGANLWDADLRGANLWDANLRGADLRGANLRGADLRGADLRGADLRDADLRDADLRDADLRGANLEGACLPSPTMLLLASWGKLSASLTRRCMAFDAHCHPDPTAFDRWASDGPCPYEGITWQRAVQFQEERALWVSDMPLESPLTLAQALIEECCKKEE